MNEDGTVSVCIANRHPESTDVRLTADFGIDRDFRVYRYDADNVPRNKFADLQDYDCKAAYAADSGAAITLHGNSVTVITTDYIDRVPTLISGLNVSGDTVSWEESADELYICSVDIYGNCLKPIM